MNTIRHLTITILLLVSALITYITQTHPYPSQEGIFSLCTSTPLLGGAGVGYDSLIQRPIILSLTNTIQSQNKRNHAEECLQIAHQLAKESAVEAANICAVEAADSFLQLQDWVELYTCYRLITANALRFQSHSEASRLFQRALSQIEKEEGKEALQTKGLIHHLQSAVYHDQGCYQKSIQSGTKAIGILEQFEDPPYLERVYYNLASAYHTESVDFQKTILYSNRALQIHFNKPKLDSSRVHRLYVLLGKAYRGLREYEKAIEAYQKGETYLSVKDNRISYLLSMVYLDKKDCQKALVFAEKALNLALQEKSEIDSDIYLRLALAHQCNENQNQAIYYYQKALTNSQKTHGTRHPEHAKIHVYLGDFYQAYERLDDALSTYQKALHLLEPDFDATNVQKNPNIAQSYTSIWSIEAIRNKAAVFIQKFENSQDLHYLQLALESYELVLQNIEFRQRQYTHDESKHYLLSYLYDAYEGAVKVSFRLYELTQENSYFEKTFRFIEASKASVLKEATHENALQYSSSIPQSLLQEWEGVKITLAQKEKVQYDLKKRLPIDMTAMERLQTELFELNRKKEQLSQRLLEYPDYTRLKYTQKPPTTSEIQTELTAQQAMIEYFVGETHLYACLFTRDTSLIYSQMKPKGFDEQVQNLRQVLTDWHFVADSTTEAAQKYVELSTQLYDHLLKKTLSYLKNQEQLIIVPDGILGYVPFEVLLSSPPKNIFHFQHYPYLIKEYSVSYAYASSLWMENKQKKDIKSSDYSFGGFAPSYQALTSSNEVVDSLKQEDPFMAMNVRKGLGELVYTQKIVSNLASLLGGQKWLAEAATKENFQKTAANYRVLHLAMHGIIDDTNPLYSHLLFTENEGGKDNRLTAAELYHMQLNAGLAVLSACNTGVGELKKGEGIMSLSRAFALAGCPSMVMSLWSVPDEQTGRLMEDFYSELKKGSTKNEALRQAKLQYLEGQDNRGGHPYLWAGFVVIGDTDSIDFDGGWESFNGLLASLALVLLIVVGVFYFKRSNSSAS